MRDEFQVEAAEKRGRKYPEWFEQCPSLDEFDGFYWKAFHELSTERQITMGGAGPIPWGRIKEYALDAGLDDDNREVFKIVIQKMDEVFLTDQHEQLELKRKEKK